MCVFFFFLNTQRQEFSCKIATIFICLPQKGVTLLFLVLNVIDEFMLISFFYLLIHWKVLMRIFDVSHTVKTFLELTLWYLLTLILHPEHTLSFR